jgi:hypothetical protein
MYKLLDRNIPPYRRYISQPVLKSANKVLYWDRSDITDTTVDFGRTDTAPVNRQNKTALAIGIAIPLTHNIPNTEAEKIPIYENLVLEIKNIWKLNNLSVCPVPISA